MFDAELSVPATCRCVNICKCLHPGDRVKLGRFQSATWVVEYGWYSYAGNRSVCGWYLVNALNHTELKPLNMTDLDDIYMIER